MRIRLARSSLSVAVNFLASINFAACRHFPRQEIARDNRSGGLPASPRFDVRRARALQVRVPAAVARHTNNQCARFDVSTSKKTKEEVTVRVEADGGKRLAPVLAKGRICGDERDREAIQAHLISLQLPISKLGS